MLIFLGGCGDSDTTILADLEVSAVNTSATTIAPSGNIPVSVTIHNLGGRPANSFELTLALSTDTTYDQSDYQLGSLTGSKLLAGASTTIDDTYQVPSTITSGKFYLIAVVSYLAVGTDTALTSSSTVASLTLAVGDGLTDAEFATNFADQAVTSWLGVTYTFGGRSAAGIDGAGTVLVTLQQLHYLVPDSTAHGIVANYYTNPDSSTQTFGYTQSGFVAEARGRNDTNGFTAAEFSAMQKGDLILLDYEFDNVYDHVAIYLGAYGTYTHAVFTASDYDGQGVIADLDFYNDHFTQDVVWSQTAVKRLDHAVIGAVYQAP